MSRKIILIYAHERSYNEKDRIAYCHNYERNEEISMSAFYDLIENRASCRAFQPDAIPEEILNRILTAGCQSPSAGGFQNISIIQVTDQEKRNQLVQFSRNQKFIGIAPVSLIFCIDYHRTKQVLREEPAPFSEADTFQNFVMGTVDASICAQTMVLAAEHEGLASCYIGNILNVANQIDQVFALPKHVCPVIMLTLGYPKFTVRRQPPKYSPQLIVHHNEYKEREDDTVYKAYRKQNNWKTFSAKPQWIEACCQRADQLHGSAYAQEVREHIMRQGKLSPYQFWYGCYYSEEPGFMSTADFFQYYKEKGFGWLEP